MGQAQAGRPDDRTCNFVPGRAGPGMEQLMANLLAKLRSVDALADAEYAAALDEALRFAPESAAASVS